MQQKRAEEGSGIVECASTIHHGTPDVAGPPSRTLRVLLADDNPVNRHCVCVLLRNEGYSPDLAGNGQEAVDLAASTSYDLILMDLEMPVLAGIDAVRIIRRLEQASGRRSVIVAVTGNAAGGADEAACYEAGMDAFFSKPLRCDELLRLLNQIIGIPSAP
jgi:CheY-like chemotaxis protein